VKDHTKAQLIIVTCSSENIILESNVENAASEKPEGATRIQQVGIWCCKPVWWIIAR